MISAYYDCSCNSHSLFDNLEISKSPNYEKYINKFNVIRLDIAGYLSDYKDTFTLPSKIVLKLKEMIVESVKTEFPNIGSYNSLTSYLTALVNETGKKIVFIIDEWDAIIREVKDVGVQESYFEFLRSLFKNGSFPGKCIACAYMTGILPMKTDGSQSAISNFKSYSIINPGPFAKYTGFTEEEVKKICSDFDMDFIETKNWYDGYVIPNVGSIYNPFAVMNAMSDRTFGSYWTQTSALESLKTYISLNYKGLQNDIASLIAGKNIYVDISGFQNDVISFSSKDDILTLLIHFGYLSYNAQTECVKIPNEEIRKEFNLILRHTNNPHLVQYIDYSKQLYKATLEGDSKKVAEMLDKKFINHFSLKFYNNEESLKSVIRMAYITCMDKYKTMEEIASGKGYADMIFVPRQVFDVPPIIIELKWDKNSTTALDQIKEKEYYRIFDDYDKEIILVGINYDSNGKFHTCDIETGFVIDGEWIPKQKQENNLVQKTNPQHDNIRNHAKHENEFDNKQDNKPDHDIGFTLS